MGPASLGAGPASFGVDPASLEVGPASLGADPASLGVDPASLGLTQLLRGGPIFTPLLRVLVGIIVSECSTRDG